MLKRKLCCKDITLPRLKEVMYLWWLCREKQNDLELNTSFYEGCSERMPPILLCWLMMSGADGADMEVESEPSHQYSITRCCCGTDGSRGAVWQYGDWDGSVYGGALCHWIPPRGKKRNPLTFTNACWKHKWRPNSGCEHSEAVSGVLQLWQ